MNPIIAALLVAVLAHQPTLRIERIDAPVTEIHTLAGYTQSADGLAYGWAECTRGHVDRIVVNGNDGVLFHELAHAVDCIDNGRIDGSPLPSVCTVDDCPHAWVTYVFQHQTEDDLTIINRIKDSH